MQAPFAAEAKEPACAMPIVAWGWPFKGNEATVENYRLVAGCGCTHTIQWVEDADAAVRCLDVAKAAGIRLLLHCEEVSRRPERAIPLVRDHAALAAYYLVDEPSVLKMRELGPLVKRIRALDPKHPVYMNWFGIVADKMRWYGVPTFDEYLDTSVRELTTGLYSFDVYPILTPRIKTRPLVRSSSALFLDKNWYASLEAVSTRSRRTQTPFWAFASIVPIRNHRQYDNPAPTQAHLRLQHYSNLAYGAQGIQYYDFRPSARSVEDYLLDGAPLAPDGKITPSYWRLAEVNRELVARSWVFLGSVPVCVRHAGSIPDGTTAYAHERDCPKFVREFKPDGELLISILKRKKGTAFVVVNRDPNAVSAFAARFAPGVKMVLRDGSSVPACDGFYPMDVGAAEIFVWDSEIKE